MISLVEYAKRNGIDPSTARHKAIAGGFKTAQKIGRNWMIDENEVMTDNRKSDIKLFKMRDIMTKEAYEELTPKEMKEILKLENAKQLSGFRQYETKCSAILSFIPVEFINTHTAQEIADVMIMIDKAYQSGKNNKHED